jgi:hypothetical protein
VNLAAAVLGQVTSMVASFARPNRYAWLLAMVVPALLSPGIARAEEPDVTPAFVRPEVVDRPTNGGDDERYAIDRTWLYGDVELLVHERRKQPDAHIVSSPQPGDVHQRGRSATALLLELRR